MSFLNPSVLIALSAISIPIIIHLLNLKKIKKVEFSTLMFIKEIQKSKMRRIKLKQLLLLLFRILVIAFLVLSFSRPVYEGFAGNSDMNSKSEILIFFDDSFSMNARDNSGLYLNQAKESVKKILDVHKESDDFYFIPFSCIGLKNQKILYSNKSEIIDSVKDKKSSDKYTSANSILNYAENIISGSKTAGKEIYIISDFQKSNFINQSAFDQSAFDQKNKNTLFQSAKLFLIDIGQREVMNLSMDSFSVATKIPEKDKDIKLKIYLNNYSPYNVKNKTINLVINNELKGEKSVDVDSYGKKEVVFNFKPQKTGYISGYLELIQSDFAEDELIQDNKYYFNINIPEEFKILFVDDNFSNINFKFIETALQSSGKLLSDSSGQKNNFFKIDKMQIIDESIKNSDVVFISGKKSFTENESVIIKDYISGGGGVFLFLGKDIDIKNYNSVFLNNLTSIRIDKFNDAIQLNSNLKFEKIDFEHPVLSEVFKNQNLNFTDKNVNIESPVIINYFELLSGANVNPVITFNNNKTFLAESKYNEGKLMIASLSASDEMSDFPLNNIFLPLIIRSIFYLSNNYEYKRENIVGNNNLIELKKLENISAFTLPDKEKLSAESINKLFKKENEYLFFQYSDYTKNSGQYVIEDSSGKIFQFSLNCNPLESETAKKNKEELMSYYKNNGLENTTYIKSNESISKIIDEQKSGFGLWKYLLAAALVFIVAEIFLSKKLENT